MKVYRYMSAAEFSLFNSGITISGSDRCHHCRTTSNGVCFLSERTTATAAYGHILSFTAEEAYSFLSGIVSDELLVCFEADSALFTRSTGSYADPTGAYCDTIVAAELCTPEYSRDSFTCVWYKWVDDPIKYAG